MFCTYFKNILTVFDFLYADSDSHTEIHMGHTLPVFILFTSINFMND